MNYPECLKCDCTFSTGCKRETPDGQPKPRKYVMTKPRGRRGAMITGGKGFPPRKRKVATNEHE